MPCLSRYASFLAGSALSICTWTCESVNVIPCISTQICNATYAFTSVLLRKMRVRHLPHANAEFVPEPSEYIRVLWHQTCAASDGHCSCCTLAWHISNSDGHVVTWLCAPRQTMFGYREDMPPQIALQMLMRIRYGIDTCRRALVHATRLCKLCA